MQYRVFFLVLYPSLSTPEPAFRMLLSSPSLVYLALSRRPRFSVPLINIGLAPNQLAWGSTSMQIQYFSNDENVILQRAVPPPAVLNLDTL
ncbi:hypothetical protein B0H19DRAFT_67933 [Mycena capillaripes]|nr:hypothetical protein B0H19DRAFT_67933 [Mycena capillaripes]